MAVATHVSRVAKEYAPYGYSVMEDVVCRFESIANSGGDDSATVAIYTPMDADVYVESAAIVFDTAAAAGATWDMDIVNATDAGTPTLNSSSVSSGGITAFTSTALGIDQNQVVNADDVLVLDLSEDAASAALPSGMVLLRLRRKA
jgi:threonine/homoserine efflux transporter RhtA